MGELIRQVLVDLMKDDLIFIGVDRERLLERGSFFTRYASEIESDPVGDYTRTRQALEVSLIRENRDSINNEMDLLWSQTEWVWMGSYEKKTNRTSSKIQN